MNTNPAENRAPGSDELPTGAAGTPSPGDRESTAFERPATYAGTVPTSHGPQPSGSSPRSADTAPTTAIPTATYRLDSQGPGGSIPSPGGWWARLWRNLGRDAALIAPGLLITVVGFPVLVALFAASAGTFVVWIGALLLPITLLVASGFATISRARVRLWGVPIAEVVRPHRAPGLRGLLAVMKEGRRWLDLLFETIIALPLRIITFTVSLAWFAAALGGVSFFVWGRFLPGDSTDWPELLVAAMTDSPIRPVDFGTDAIIQFGTGLVLALTFPFVLHVMALLEVVAVRAGLDTTPKVSTGFPGSFGPETPMSSDGPGGSPLSSVPPQPRKGVGPDATGPTKHGVSSKGLSGHALLSTAEGWSWLCAIIAAIVLTAVSWPVTATLYTADHYTFGVLIAMFLAAGFAAAIITSVKWPTVSIGLLTLSSAVSILTTAVPTGIPWPWTVTALLSQLVVHIIIGTRHPWPYLLVTWVLGLLLGLAGLTLPRAGGLDGELSNVILFTSLSTGLAIIALLLRGLLLNYGALTTERQLSAEELAKRQNLEERNRIAQELHDVVAHSMSVISVQATTARYRLPELDEASRTEFDSIAGSARQALTEMRGLLALLRGTRDAELAPQPGLDDIPDMVVATRGSGAEVVLDFPEPPPEVPATVGLTAYRIVQEGLSNALRHAPGSRIAVSVGLTAQHPGGGAAIGTPGHGTGVGAAEHPGESAIGRELVITVADAPSVDGDFPTAGHSTVGPRPAGHGHGLPGMRERVEALGGRLAHGPTSEGGFAITAQLPIG